MTIILDTHSKQRYPLRSHHIIGRNAETADTVVSRAIVSRVHAALEWTGANWQVRDLSRNGTWLRDTRLNPNESVAVAAGDKLFFGSPEAPAWELVDDSAPRSRLVGTSADAPHLDLEPFLLLPDADAPELALYYAPLRRCWLSTPVSSVSDEPEETPIRHGDTLVAGGHSWTLFMAEAGDTTEPYPPTELRLPDFEFVFDLSLDEEVTQLTLQHDHKALDLGERTHHYLLLHLARIRAEHAREGLDAKSQGWIESSELARQLGVDLSHLNILIFRARKQLADNLGVVMDSAELVQRRKGRVRFGCSQFRIFKGESLTCAMSPPAAADL